MAAVDVEARNKLPVATDDLDDLFDYDVPADIFQDVDTNMEVPSGPAKVLTGDAGKGHGGGLGLDEEIKVTKKRAPRAKLDETRLLSQAGIPKLKKITKDRLKFKGKGHEYSDVTCLLNIYQLWLDDLYPRAKFADGLAMIEKLGHKKRLLTMRKEWINEAKLKDKYDETELMPKRHEQDQTPARAVQRPTPSENQMVDSRPLAAASWDDDDRLERPRTADETKEGTSQNALADTLFISEDEREQDARPEDDLDALLAEQEMNAETAPNQRYSGIDGRDHNFDDEMEAMAEIDAQW